MPLDLPQIHTPSEIGSHFRETPAVDPNDQMPSETAPSEFVAERYESRVRSEDTSSVASSSGGGLRSGGVFEVPPPPKLGSEEKEKQCPYCQLVLPARTFNEKRWARHLLEDLQPYYCLYKSCKQPHKTFTRYKSWTNHLSQPHSEPGSDHSPEILPLVCFVCLAEQSSITTLAMHMKSHLSSVSVLALPARDDLNSSHTDSDRFSSGKATENRTISSHNDDLPELFDDEFGSGESSERKDFALGLHAREGNGAYQDSENLSQWAANTNAEIAEVAQPSIPSIGAAKELPPAWTDESEFFDSDHDSGSRSPTTTSRRQALSTARPASADSQQEDLSHGFRRRRTSVPSDTGAIWGSRSTLQMSDNDDHFGQDPESDDGREPRRRTVNFPSRRTRARARSPTDHLKTMYSPFSKPQVHAGPQHDLAAPLGSLEGSLEQLNGSDSAIQGDAGDISIVAGFRDDPEFPYSPFKRSITPRKNSLGLQRQNTARSSAISDTQRELEVQPDEEPAGSDSMLGGGPRYTKAGPSSRSDWAAARRRLVTQYEIEDPTEKQRRELGKSGKLLHEIDPPRPENKTLSGRAQNLWRRLRRDKEQDYVEVEGSTMTVPRIRRRTSTAEFS